MAGTRSGNGYWLVAADGGIFTFGDAAYKGSSAARTVTQPIAGMTATGSGHGYWLVGRDGSIFSFGDAVFHGTPATPPASPVVGLAATPTGNGYWMATADGGVLSFGDAPYRGSLGASHPTAPVVGLVARHVGAGYWMATGMAVPPVVDLGSFEATCYALRGGTASGIPVSDQVVAVDPSVIPLGTHLFIPGLGLKIAADTGGAIRGHRLDIWADSNQACYQFGVQTLKVYRLP
jgi:3D (Asp-Asp-Asp) domain-containing protein